MSSLTSTNIAASIAQGALQQSQTAKARDAKRNQAAYRSMQLKAQDEKDLETVEDSYQTTDEHLTVRDDDEQSNKQKYQPNDDEPGEHVDLQA